MRSNPTSIENALRLVNFVLKHADEKLAARLKIEKFVGSGTFSNVFKGILNLRQQSDDESGPQVAEDEEQVVEVAVKHLLNFNAPPRLRTELCYLQKFGGQASIVQVFQTCEWNGHVLLILPFVDAESFDDFIREPPSTETIRDYLIALLQSLAVMHKENVIHRDLKPDNFLIGKYDHVLNKRTFMLIDFGLSEEVVPFKKPKSFAKVALVLNRSDKKRNRSYEGSPARRSFLSSSGNKKIEIISPRTPLQLSPQNACHCLGAAKTCTLCHGASSNRTVLKAHRRAGTAGFRPPEVLMRTNVQSTGIDIWCCGVILLSIITGKFPFFHGKGGDDNSLAQLTTIFGMKSMQDCSNIVGRNFISNCGSKRMKLKSLCSALRCKSGNVETALVEFCDSKQCFNFKSKKNSTVEESQQGLQKEVRKDDDSNSDKEELFDSGFSSEENMNSSSEIENVSVMSSSFGSPSLNNNAAVSVKNKNSVYLGYPDSLYHLLIEFMDLNPFTRITAEEALKHPFIQVSDYLLVSAH